MKNTSTHGEHGMSQPEKTGFWQKLGGGALSIAIIIHVVLAIGGGIWIAQRIFAPENEPPDFASGGGQTGAGERSAQSNVKQRNRAQITQTASEAKRVIANEVASTVHITNSSDHFGDLSDLPQLTNGGGIQGSLDGLGGDGLGKGKWGGGMPGPGDGTKQSFKFLDPSVHKRCSKQDRLARIKENGGTEVCEEAVLKGLRWLKANQNPDGSWGDANQPAMTGLALLAYFGHCETPVSEEFGESCVRGIGYLVNTGAKNNGRIAVDFTANSWVYEHAIATYALGEAATFCKEVKYDMPSLMEVTEKAGQFIIDNQNANGGWAYKYVKEGGHTDGSVVGWQLQALKACKHTHIKYQGMESSVRKGLDHLSELQGENGSFGYNTPGGHALTGVGTLCFQMWGKEKSKEARNGVKFIKENFKFDWDTNDSDLYSHYYASQAMMQAGGSNWKTYNKIFRDQLLDNQNSDGSWKAPAFTGHGQSPGNAVYRNTLCILMLEVYYRFLATSGGDRHDRPSF